MYLTYMMVVSIGMDVYAFMVWIFKGYVRTRYRWMVLLWSCFSCRHFTFLSQQLVFQHQIQPQQDLHMNPYWDEQFKYVNKCKQTYVYMCICLYIALCIFRRPIIETKEVNTDLKKHCLSILCTRAMSIYIALQHAL